MKTQQFSKLLELAKLLGWKVWTYVVPDRSQPAEPGYIREKRIFVLRSPNGVPFRDGKPVVAEQISEEGSASPDVAATTFQFKAPARETELEAWQDLPQTEDQLREYSGR